MLDVAKLITNFIFMVLQWVQCYSLPFRLLGMQKKVSPRDKPNDKLRGKSYFRATTYYRRRSDVDQYGI